MNYITAFINKYFKNSERSELYWYSLNSGNLNTSYTVSELKRSIKSSEVISGVLGCSACKKPFYNFEM